MILAAAAVDLPAGCCRLQVRSDGRFDFFVCRMKPKDSVFLEMSGPITELPLAAEGLQLCFRAIPPAILANIVTTAQQSPPDPTAPPPH